MAISAIARHGLKPIASPTSSANSPSSSPRLKSSVSTLLSYFETPGVAPPFARVDPAHKVVTAPPTKLWQIWKYGAAAAAKGIEVAGDILSHHIHGPRRPSWGIEMTIISSMMRGAGRHSHLVDITFIRKLMSLSGLMPLPSDALVTPVTFRVRKRNLRGILAEYDQLETGKRELAGEWIVGKRLWRRLQSEWKAKRNEGQFPAPDTSDHRHTERVVLYVHGGAYYMFDITTHRLLTIPLSKYVDARVFAINYRLAPETRFPGSLQDVVSSYFRLIDDLQIPPENILVAGDSAGGALCLALLMYLRDNEYPLPAGAMLFSPWVDLTMSCDSWDSNYQFDVVPRPRQGDAMDPIYCYLGEDMEKYLTHPYASPLFGDFRGLPPMLIQGGDCEVLRDEITLLAHKATLAGVDVRHELYQDAVHVFQAFPFLECARKSFMSCRDFVKNSLPMWQSQEPKILCGDAEKGLAGEINNNEAKIVGGDGVEVASKEDRDISWSRSSSSERDEEDISHSSQEEDSSWGTDDSSAERNSWWSDQSTNDGDAANALHVPSAPSSGWQAPFQRIKSAISLIVEATSASFAYAPLSSSIAPAAARSRAPSISNRPTAERRASYHRTPLPRMESVQHPAPRPIMRPSSHVDISTLCQDWAESGPANRTVNYKSLNGSQKNGRGSRSIRPVVDAFTLVN